MAVTLIEGVPLLLSQNYLISTASLIRGMSGESLCVMESAYERNKGVLCSSCNDDHQISGKAYGLHIAVVIRT
jgi:hypothetical protein